MNGSAGDFTNIDIHLVNYLRTMARAGFSPVEIIHAIRREPLGDSFLFVLKCLMVTFEASLSDVRRVEGGRCMGNAAFDDDEINAMLQPLIERYFAQQDE